MKKRQFVTTLFSLSLLLSPLACNSHRPVFVDDAVSLKETSKTATSAPAAEPTTPTGIALKQSVMFLASDQLEGRGLGSAGLDQAASFVTGSFVGSGLQRLPGMGTFTQAFELKSVEGVASETVLKINGIAAKLDEEFRPASMSAEKSFDGQAVFVGYGISSTDYKYDDYADVDVRGKIAVAWRFEPADGEGKSRFTQKDWSEHSQLQIKVKNAVDRGAIALILINPPKAKTDGKLMRFSRDFMGTAVSIPVCHLKTETGNALIKAGTGDDAAALQEEIDGDVKPRSTVLNDVKITGNFVFKHVTRNLKNIVAYIPGTGSTADEYVVLGGHYDHLGKGGFGSLAVKSQEIHHGADDNASGSAAVIELAKQFGARYSNGWRPKRSIIFICFTAEEEGLIGSKYFVKHCPVPLNKIAAMLNLDMVGRMRDNVLYIGGSGTAASFESLLQDASPDVSIKLKNMGRGGRGPSDHMSFAMKKVPVMFFFTGLHGDYHRPTDTVDKVNFNGMALIVEYSGRVIEAMTTMPKEEYITEADAHSMPMGQAGPTTGPSQGVRRVMLGVVPSYGDASDVKGAKIDGTTPGSPADKAGLQGGDIITGFSGKSVDNLEDLSLALVNAKAGQKVEIKIVRSGKEMKLEATLAERD